MGGTDKSQAPIAGRPALRWAVDAMRGAAVGPAHHRGHGRRTAGRPAGRALDRPRRMSGRARRCPATGLRGPWRPGQRMPMWSWSMTPRDRSPRPPSWTGSRRPPRSTAPRSRSLPVPDSLKLVANGQVTGTADRSTLFRAQTPQGARRELLLAAIDAWADGPELFGDEQELLARDGVPVVTVAGESAALKITEAADLDVVRALARTTGTGAGRAQPRCAMPGAATAIPSVASTACDWPAWTSPRRPGCMVTPTAMPRCTPSATGSWPRLAWATWAACSRRAMPPPGASTAATCCARSWHGWTRQASGRCPLDLTITARPAPPRWRASGPDAGHPRRTPGSRSGCHRGPGVDRQPVGRRGSRPNHQRQRTRGRVDGMTLTFRNTLGGALEPFEPIDPANVRMYTCGPTVYAPAHVGNFRSFVFADLDPALPDLEGLPGHLGDEHHRRRGQDHP